jgi:hypothetical protein
MRGFPIYLRLLIVAVTAAVTFLHQRVALGAWPLQSHVGSALMAAPTALVVTVGVALLLFGSLRVKSTQGVAGRSLGVVIPTLLLGVFFEGVIRLGDGMFLPVGSWYSPGSLVYLFGVLGFFVSVAAAVAWRARRWRPLMERYSSWGVAEWLLSVMLALNLFFLALPEVRFVTTFESPGVDSSHPLTLYFGLQYADVLAMHRNPILDTTRWILSFFTPAHFLTQMACVYLMAFSIGLFCLAVSGLIGYAATFALVSSLAWSKSILLVVCTGTNIVTLFLAVAFALYVLSRVFIVTSTSSGAIARILAGFLIGIAVTLSLYTYAPSRVPCFLFAGLAALLLAWAAVRDAGQRLVYAVALVATLAAPAGVVFGHYGGNIAAFQRDFSGSVLPGMSRIRSGRPEFVSPELEAATPDLPIIYGALITDVPQMDGSTSREWVYWRRSVREFGWVFSEHLSRVFRRYQPFPGGEVWWFFGLIGLAISARMMISKRASLLYAVGVAAVTAVMIAPFLIVPSPFEWRRGAAVMLVFASFGGLGIYFVLRMCAPRTSAGLTVVVAAIFTFLIFGKSSLRLIAVTPFAEVAIAVPCRMSFIKPLLAHAMGDVRMRGALYVVGSAEDRCLYSASRQLDRGLGSGNRVKLLSSLSLSMDNLRQTLLVGDSVAVECGGGVVDAVKALCDELRRDPNARAVYSAPQDGDELWVFTK